MSRRDDTIWTRTKVRVAFPACIEVANIDALNTDEKERP